MIVDVLHRNGWRTRQVISVQVFFDLCLEPLGRPLVTRYFSRARRRFSRFPWSRWTSTIAVTTRSISSFGTNASGSPRRGNESFALGVLPKPAAHEHVVSDKLARLNDGQQADILRVDVDTVVFRKGDTNLNLRGRYVRP